MKYVRFGVLRFQVLRRGRRAAGLRAGGRGRIVWHGDSDLDGIDAVVVPGGFSYGDYLRVGSIARFAPAMEKVMEFAAGGGPVLGICNGFQVLCEAGLLPGALLPNEGLRFLCRQVDVEVADADTAWTRASAPATCSRSRSSTTGAGSPRRAARRVEANGQVVFRRERRRTARSTTLPASASSAATSSG